MKKQTYIYLALALSAYSAGWYFLYYSPKRKRQQLAQQAADTQAVIQSKPSINWRDDSFPLSLGSKGGRVREVQKYSNNVCGARLSVDGVWGYITDAAVKSCIKLSSIGEIYYKSNLVNLFPLKYGDNNEKICKLQLYLKKMGNDIDLNCKFDDKTLVAFKEQFQGASKMYQATYEALNIENTVIPQSLVGYIPGMVGIRIG